MISRWFVHEGVIETFEGGGAYGDSYAAPITDKGLLASTVKLVRDVNGQQVVSSSTWYTSLTNAANYTPDSKFTDPNGRVSHVIGVNVNDTGGLMPNVEHVAVNLT